MFEVFSEFVAEEQIKSSSRTMSQIIDEWEHVFAKDVNLILLKCFMRFVQANGMQFHQKKRKKINNKWYNNKLGTNAHVYL